MTDKPRDKPGDTLLPWAAVGSRISGFHHDSASKLQSLMMALDEAVELVGDSNPDARRSLDTATAAVRDLHQLRTENRALAKTPVRKTVSIADLLQRAAARHGVKLRGELPLTGVHVAMPSIVHALGLLCEQCAGSLHGTRTVEIAVAAAPSQVTVLMTGSLVAVDDSITVAGFLLEREDGTLERIERGFVVQLPTSVRSAADNP
jgi:hypothetical protein